MRTLLQIAIVAAATAGLMTAQGCKTMTKDGETNGSFGVTADGKSAKLFTLTNASGMTVKLTDFGATITEIHVPDRAGKLDDVVNGFDDVSGYESDANQYFGCTTGRVANRIKDGKFTLHGKEYQLAKNNGPNHLHGGDVGLNKRIWEAERVMTSNGPGVRFRYFSPDGEEGYPGNLGISVTYSLSDKNEIHIDYVAQTDQPTPVNLTNHSYFNLAGHGNGTILDHVLSIKASNYTPVDATLIPTGEIAPVKGTALDFTTPTEIGARIDQFPPKGEDPGGYDHNFVLDNQDGDLEHAATLYHKPSGRVLMVYSDQPGIQFYSGNFLFGQKGKGGAVYQKNGALCLEPQHYPDSINKPNFPSVVLKPGEQYTQRCIFRFATDEQLNP